MALFRKKPVTIEALQFEGLEWSEDGEYSIRFDTVDALPVWLRAALLDEVVYADAEETRDNLLVKTLEGVMSAAPGDWIIRGVKGEIYPCKPDIFAMTYDAVED